MKDFSIIMKICLNLNQLKAHLNIICSSLVLVNNLWGVKLKIIEVQPNQKWKKAKVPYTVKQSIYCPLEVEPTISKAWGLSLVNEVHAVHYQSTIHTHTNLFFNPSTSKTNFHTYFTPTDAWTLTKRNYGRVVSVV